MVNVDIIEMYLEGKEVDEISKSWIFDCVEEGIKVFEKPLVKDTKKFLIYYQNILDTINNFKPYNLNLWKSLYGENYLSNEVDIFLTVGLPDPYDALVRENPQGKKIIIFDLIRIMSYSENIDDFIDVFRSLMTHEFSHIFLGNRHKNLYKRENINIIKDIVFDEGFAHLLSFKEEVLELDFDIYNDKKNFSYERLKEVVEKNYIEEEEVLVEANQGKYWDKYGAISGKFLILDYYIQNGKKIEEIKNLYEKGPEYLWNFFKENVN